MALVFPSPALTRRSDLLLAGLVLLTAVNIAVMVPAHVIAGAFNTHRANLIFNWAIPTVLVIWAAKQTARTSASAHNDQALRRAVIAINRTPAARV
jgi:hypothetical protein